MSPKLQIFPFLLLIISTPWTFATRVTLDCALEATQRHRNFFLINNQTQNCRPFTSKRTVSCRSYRRISNIQSTTFLPMFSLRAFTGPINTELMANQVNKTLWLNWSSPGTTNVPGRYKSPLIHAWKHLAVTTVKVELLADGNLKGELIFDAGDTANLSQLLQSEHLISSNPWKLDVLKAAGGAILQSKEECGCNCTQGVILITEKPDVCAPTNTTMPSIIEVGFDSSTQGEGIKATHFQIVDELRISARINPDAVALYEIF